MNLLKGTALSLLMSSMAFAGLGDKLERNWEKSTGISKVYGGFSSETTNFGLSHERRQGSLGWDALAIHSSDNGETGLAKKDAQTLFGTSLIHHLEDNSNADVYLGTGIAAIMHYDINNTDEDETSFGPLFRIGSSYYFNNDWSLGLEYLAAMNWSNNELAAETTFGFLTLGYTY